MRLKNIEAKNEEQVTAIEDQGKEQLYAIKYININSKPLATIGFFSTLSDETEKLMENIKLIDDWLETAELVCTKTDGRTKYDFSKFTFLPKLTLKNFFCELALQQAKYNQVNLEILINMLNNSYNPKNPEKKNKMKIL